MEQTTKNSLLARKVLTTTSKKLVNVRIETTSIRTRLDTGNDIIIRIEKT